MAAIPDPVLMLKPGEDRVSILANRTLTIIGQDDGKFLVSVADRDYKYDPSGGEAGHRVSRSVRIIARS
jgi:hypothetical protein